MDGNYAASRLAMKDLAGESDESDEEFDESGAHQSWMTRLTNRADHLRVTPDTLVESLYRIPDTYFAEILTSLDHDRRRSEMVQNDIRAEQSQLMATQVIRPSPSQKSWATWEAEAYATVRAVVPHRVNRSILESPVIGWAPHPSVQEINLGSGHTYDLPITPDSLRQWLRPMPTRALPP